MSFVATGLVSINTTTVMGMPQTLPDFESQLKIGVAAALNPTGIIASLASSNPIKNQAQLYAAFVQWAQGLLATYPGLNADNPKDSNTLIYQYFMTYWNELMTTPVDATGARAAGMVAARLGSIPFANGSLDLSGFPLVVVAAPVNQSADPSRGFPMSVFLSPQAAAQPGIFTIELLGPTYTGGPNTLYPNEPASWQQWAANHGVSY